MVKNMGVVDRVVRFLAVVVIGTLYLMDAISGTLAVVLGIVAVAFLATSLLGRCPAYLPLGLSTCRSDEPSAG